MSEVDAALSALEGVSEIDNLEDTRPAGVEGVSVKFEPEVNGSNRFRDAVSILKSRLEPAGVVIRNYSNMTSVGDDVVIVLVEVGVELDEPCPECGSTTGGRIDEEVVCASCSPAL